MHDIDEASEKLAQTIHEGERTMPSERPLLMCKPSKIESWRIFKIMSEFIEGFDIIRRYGLAATFFGSVRTSPDTEIYKQATELASRLSKKGFAIVTGGSSGIMQAANKGAFDMGGAFWCSLLPGNTCHLLTQLRYLGKVLLKMPNVTGRYECFRQ
jgi:hypothetical protein